MNQDEWDAEVAALIALARARRDAAQTPLDALHAWLVVMAGVAMRTDEIGRALALFDLADALSSSAKPM